MRFRFTEFCASSALLLALHGSASAAGTCSDEKFQRASKRALEAYNKGEFDSAVQQYEKAYECQRKPVVLFNLGQAARKAKRYREALTYFRRYLDDEPAPSPAIREELDQHVRQLERMVRDAEQLRQMASADGSTDAAPAERTQGAAALTPAEPAPAGSGVAPSGPTGTGKDLARPLYKKPWFWAAVGGGVVVLGVVTGVSVWAATHNRIPADYGTPYPVMSPSALTISFGGTR